MDGLSAAASVIAVIQISESVASLCSQYFTAVKNAKPDIERLQGELSSLKNVLENARRLLEDPNGPRLKTSQLLRDTLNDCSSQLKDSETKLEEKLNTRKKGKIMSRFGLRALKWPFESKDVDGLIQTLKQCRDSLSASIIIDQAAEVLGISQKLDLSNLPTAKDAAFDSHAEEHNARCHPDTRIELLCQIKKWANDPRGECIFWLKGMAGTGKSTISHTVAQLFASKGMLGASFFFKRGERDRGNASLFFTTIAVQLVAKETALATFVRAAIEADPAVSGKALKEQFEKLVLEPLGKLTGDPDKPKTIVMVIDALDECEERDVKSIIHLLPRAKALTSLKLRIFVTSRPQLPIQLGFGEIKGKYQDMVLHEIPPSTIEHDIAAYLEDELAGIMKKHNDLVGQDRQLPPDWPGQATVKVLVDMAVPLFIFAATVCRFISDRRLGSPEQQLQRVLAYQAKTTESEMDKLDATYCPILDQLVFGLTNTAKRHLIEGFRDVVGSIVFLAEPLSTSSLARLLDIPRPTIDSRLESLHSVLSVPSSADLPVRLLHLSFRNFLVDSDKRETYPFWIDKRECHMRIANRCLRILDSSGHLKRDICGLEKPGKMRMEVDLDTIQTRLPAHVRYACQYWVHHLEQSHGRIRDGDHAHLFLKCHFLHWLEALSFIGKASDSIGMVTALQSMAPDENSHLHNMIHDAKRFILYNRSVIEKAPLQLYSAALVFAPKTSIVREQFLDQFPRWICRSPEVHRTWDSTLQTLEGHSRGVNAVAFSPDGQLLASASYDHTIRLWDASTGVSRSTLEGHSLRVNAVVFSPDGQLLASASYDNTVRLWDASTGMSRSTLEGHSRSVNAVAFSPDGQLLASVSYDKTVRLWDASTGVSRSTLEGHSSFVNAVAFSPDGQLLASASCDNTVRLWDASTGVPRSTLGGHSSFVNAVAFSPDGQLLASTSYDNTVRLWDASTGVPRSTLEGHSSLVNAVAFSPDGQLLASASCDNTIRLWDASTGMSRSTLEGHSLRVNAIAFSPDGQLLASASCDNTVRLWDASTGVSRSTLEGHSSFVNAVAFSPNGQLLASVSYDKTVRLWDASTGVPRSTLEGHSWSVNAVAFSPDGQLLASASDDNTVRLWDASTGVSRSTLEGHSRSVNAVAFSPDGQLLASTSYDNTVRLWDASTGVSRSTLEGHSLRVNAIAFSPDGQLLASASGDNTVRLWDASTGVPRSTLEGHSSRVNAVAFSPDGQLLASASDDNTVRLWDASTGVSRSTLKGHSLRVNAIAFSPNGQLLASASYDNTVRLWDALTGASRGTFRIEGSIYDLSFSSDGSYLKTERGLLELNSQPRSDFSPYLYVKNRWVMAYRNENILWLPADYRPTCLAVRDNILVMGHASGRVTFIEFDMDKIPLGVAAV